MPVPALARRVLGGSVSTETLLRWAALVIWGIVLAASLGRVALMHNPKHLGIFPVYFDGGRNWASGQDVYADHDGLVFRYSPIVAACLSFMALVPPWLGNLVIRAANDIVYLGGVMCWARYGVPVRDGAHLDSRSWWALSLLLVPLSVSGLVDVQFNALIIGFMLLAVAAVRRDHWNWAAGLLAAAVLVKVYPIALALLLVVLFPRKFSWRFALALLLGLLLPFVLQTPVYVWRQYERWFDLLLLNDRQGATLGHWYRDVRLLAEAFGWRVSSQAYAVMQATVALGIAGFCLWLRRVQVAPAQVLATALGLSCCWMMAFGPATEQTTYIVLAPALAWATLEVIAPPATAAWRWLAGGIYWTFVFTQVVVWFPCGKQIHNLGLHAAATLLLMGLIVGRAIAATRPSQRNLFEERL